MFVCKLRTQSCCHYEHFHVNLAYRRQTGNVVTERPPNKTTHHTFQGVLMIHITGLVSISINL